MPTATQTPIPQRQDTKRPPSGASLDRPASEEPVAVVAPPPLEQLASDRRLPVERRREALHPAQAHREDSCKEEASQAVDGDRHPFWDRRSVVHQLQQLLWTLLAHLPQRYGSGLLPGQRAPRR